MIRILAGVAILVLVICDSVLACGTTSEIQLDSAGKILSSVSPGTCTWKYKAPAGQKVLITCNTFNIGPAGSCTGDHVLMNGKKYCGTSFKPLLVASDRLEVNLVGKAKGSITCIVAARFDPCDCGRRLSTRIVGGTNALLHEFPYQAAIVEPDGSKIQCGATIISETYALTAAHCVQGKTAADINLRVGEHDITKNSETSYTVNYKVLSIVIHPTADIAIIRTVTMKFNDKVGPVCMPIKYEKDLFNSSTVTVAGWGTTDFAGPLPAILQKVDLKTISNDECKTTHSALTASEICTFLPGKDTCQYDSGTGIHFTGTNSRLYIIGVVSRGSGCATSPAINVRVTALVPWILMKTPEAAYCNI